MNTYKFNIYRPGGNDTALVETFVKQKSLKLKINRLIMERFPNVEQVGFLDIENNILEMAGGEFCGNATRAAAYRILNGSAGTINIQVSGTNNKLQAGVTNDGFAWAQMPIYKSLKTIAVKNGYYIVRMRGITHVVSLNEKTSSPESAKKTGYKILKEFGFLKKYPASGVIYANSSKKKTRIEPVVWVRDIKTLFYETACASGTTALGIVEAYMRKKSIVNLPVLQPSGSTINVNVFISNNMFQKTTITGTIATIKENFYLKI